MTIPEFYEKNKAKNKLKSKVQIISHRKKRPAHDTTSLDLSVSCVENEGLGIYTSYDRDRRNAENSTNTASLTAASIAHNRATSGGTQYSVTMVPTQYVHPMRQVPRPYTPPGGIANSHSVVGSDSGGYDSVMIDGCPATPGGREAGTEPRPSFNFANDSLSLFPTASFTNVAGTASPRSWADNASYRENESPVPRSSLEFPFRSKSRTSTRTDPMARAAAVQAARQAFEDREMAKARKLEKARDKLQRREQKELEQQQQPRQRCTHLVDFSFRDHRGSDHERPPRSEDSRRNTGYGSNEKSEGYRIRSPKSAWLLFITWLQTRIFKMGRRIKNKSS